jgi:hypothetical protein
MAYSKPWWHSSTVICGALAAFFGALQAALTQGGLPIPQIILHPVTEILDGLTTLLSLGAVGGRLVATKVLTK